MDGTRGPGRFDTYWMALALLVVGVCSILWGELIPVRDGSGWDGDVLRRISLDLPRHIREGLIDDYRIRRIGPSAIAFAVLTLGNIEPVHDNVILVWQALNLAYLVMASFVWMAVARTIELGRAGRIVGFIGLFISFSALKMSFYTPILTDGAGLLITVTLLYAWLRGARWGIALVAVAAALVWPTTFYAALVLLVVPRTTSVASLSNHEPPYARLVSLAGAAALAIAVLGWLVRTHSTLDGFVVKNGAQAWSSTFWFSALLAAAFVGAGVRPLLQFLASTPWVEVRRWLSSWQTWASAVFSVLLWKGAAFTYAALAGKKFKHDEGWLVDRLVYEGAARPLVFLVSHVIYLGPVLLLAVFLWPRVARTLYRWGPGAVGLAAGFLILALGSESRTIITLVPFFVAATAKVVDELSWGRRRLVVLAVCAIAVSRFWLPLNHGDIPVSGDRLLWPAQHYFMNFGPWMSDTSYLIWLAVTIATSAVLCVLLDLIPIRESPLSNSTEAITQQSSERG